MEPWGTKEHADITYRLKGLGMAGAVLHIGAHPDDEDVGLLSYLSCKFGVRTVYWSASRGEGGQNRIGPYRDEALGIYRTWESLEAQSWDRSERLFGPFYDFGYSKNAEEAFSKWGHENLVREIVRAIRQVQPHIIVCRWTGGPQDLHGHHQAVGQAAFDAFQAAGEAGRFLDLHQQGLPPWQPLKYYHSLDNSGGDLTAGGALNLFGHKNPSLEKAGVLRINTGEFDPVAGTTYQERAGHAYNRHQTQGMGMAPSPGDFFYYFCLRKSLVDLPQREAELFDGLDPTLTGLADHPGQGWPPLRSQLEAIRDKGSEAFRHFRSHDPKEAATSILEGLSLLRDSLELIKISALSREIQESIERYLVRKIRDFEEISAWCLGLKLECLSDQARITPGQRFKVLARLWNNRRLPIDEPRIALQLPEGWTYRSVGHPSAETISPAAPEEASSKPVALAYEISVPETAELSSPYWLVHPRSAYAYSWPEGEPSGRPFGPPQAMASCRVAIGPHRIELHNAIRCRESFAGGFRELPLSIIPPISLHPRNKRVFRQLSGSAQTLDIHVQARSNSREGCHGTLHMGLPSGWHEDRNQTEVLLSRAADTRTVRTKVTIPSPSQAGAYPIDYGMRCGNRDYAMVVSPVRMGAPGIPCLADGSNCIREAFLLEASRVTVHLLDVQCIHGLKYAYVQGAREELLDTLQSLGVNCQALSDEEISQKDLDDFDAVIIGPNAYLLREELRKCSSRFLDFVEQGGTLIVQYQGYPYQEGGLAPYPFRYSMPHDRVTHEDAPVHILDPDNLLFRLPNRITQNDFAGWVRERGLYFLGQWDERYHPLLACSDPGEELKQGGLVTCSLGKGSFLYTGYSFFRQLPAGVPGAFRLFANILALPEAYILERIAFLKNVSLFSSLPEEKADALARIMTERHEPAGRYICRQGEQGHEAYIVYRGEVEVLLEKDEQEEIIYLAQRGDCLGEMAIMGNMLRTASLRTRGEVSLLVISGEDFVSLLRHHPDMSIKLMRILAHRLNDFRNMARK